MGSPVACGSAAAPCAFTIGKNEMSAQIPTVGVVEWSLDGAPPSSAKIVYTLMYDNSMLPDDAAREKDKMTRTATFQRAMTNMKTLAEGGKLEDPSGFVKRMNDLLLALTMASR